MGGLPCSPAVGRITTYEPLLDGDLSKISLAADAGHLKKKRKKKEEE
jgi:hypothetical protein